MDHFHLIIVTGMSGAGKSHAVQVLEDIGYFCIDNIPPVLIPKFAELCIKGGERVRHVALIADIRGGEFFDAMSQCLKTSRPKAFPTKSSSSRLRIRPWYGAIRKRAASIPWPRMAASATASPGLVAPESGFHHRHVESQAEAAQGDPGQALCHYGQQEEHDRYRRVLRLQARHAHRCGHRRRCALPAQSLLY